MASEDDESKLSKTQPKPKPKPKSESTPKLMNKPKRKRTIAEDALDEDEGKVPKKKREPMPVERVELWMSEEYAPLNRFLDLTITSNGEMEDLVRKISHYQPTMVVAENLLLYSKQTIQVALALACTLGSRDAPLFLRDNDLRGARLFLLSQIRTLLHSLPAPSGTNVAYSLLHAQVQTTIANVSGCLHEVVTSGDKHAVRRILHNLMHLLYCRGPGYLIWRRDHMPGERFSQKGGITIEEEKLAKKRRRKGLSNSTDQKASQNLDLWARVGRVIEIRDCDFADEIVALQRRRISDEKESKEIHAENNHHYWNSFKLVHDIAIINGFRRQQPVLQNADTAWFIQGKMGGAAVPGRRRNGKRPNTSLSVFLVPPGWIGSSDDNEIIIGASIYGDRVIKEKISDTHDELRSIFVDEQRCQGTAIMQPNFCVSRLFQALYNALPNTLLEECCRYRRRNGGKTLFSTIPLIAGLILGFLMENTEESELKRKARFLYESRIVQ